MKNAQAHKVGWLMPLHEAIPEWAALGPFDPNEVPEGDSQAQVGANNWTSCQAPFNHSEDE